MPDPPGSASVTSNWLPEAPEGAGPVGALGATGATAGGGGGGDAGWGVAGAGVVPPPQATNKIDTIEITTAMGINLLLTTGPPLLLVIR